MTYNQYEARKSAAAFFDGGWRAADKEELRQQIDHVRDSPISDEELDHIVCCIAELEKEVERMDHRSEEIRKATEERCQALWDWIDGADEEVWGDEE